VGVLTGQRPHFVEVVLSEIVKVIEGIFWFSQRFHIAFSIVLALNKTFYFLSVLRSISFLARFRFSEFFAFDAFGARGSFHIGR
jgi:hypothetical protein